MGDLKGSSLYPMVFWGTSLCSVRYFVVLPSTLKKNLFLYSDVAIITSWLSLFGISCYYVVILCGTSWYIVEVVGNHLCRFCCFSAACIDLNQKPSVVL